MSASAMTADSESQPSSTDVWLARQPIVDARRRLFGWEVLFRHANNATAGVCDGNTATSAVMLNTFVEFGLENVVGDKPAFVNLTREFLTGQLPLPLCPSQLVLEVLEDVDPTEDVLQGIRHLRQQGYRIALDDLVYHPRLSPLLELAEIVKVDLPLTPRNELAEHVRQLRSHGVQLLAEKVETPEEFGVCRELGFDLFQGYFLAQPQVVRGRSLSSQQSTLLATLAKLNDARASFEELEAAIEQDAGLCVKLLRYVNSSHFGIRRSVDSLHRALVLLGLENIRTITTLLALSTNSSVAAVDVQTALTRAAMCRELADGNQPEQKHQLFTVGLLSRLDMLLQLPLEEALASLSLTEQVLSAVLDRAGDLGRTLQLVEAYETGHATAFTDQPELLAAMHLAWRKAIAQTTTLPTG